MNGQQQPGQPGAGGTGPSIPWQRSDFPNAGITSKLAPDQLEQLKVLFGQQQPAQGDQGGMPLGTLREAIEALRQRPNAGGTPASGPPIVRGVQGFMDGMDDRRQQQLRSMFANALRGQQPGMAASPVGQGSAGALY